MFIFSKRFSEGGKFYFVMKKIVFEIYQQFVVFLADFLYLVI
jgi:hypothetical protein